MYDVLSDGNDVSELLSSAAATWQQHPHELRPLPYAPERRACAVFGRSYRRVALFGGVYNNYLALDALLADAERRGADLILCLGDLGGFGPRPERVVPRLRGAAIPTLAGNYDLSLAEGAEDCGCGYTDPMDNYYAQISYAYTLANTPAEQRAWMGTLPEQARLRVGDHVVHCCHGSPRQTNEFLWESGVSDVALAKFLVDCGADVLAFTHTGLKWHRQISRVRRGSNDDPERRDAPVSDGAAVHDGPLVHDSPVVHDGAAVHEGGADGAGGHAVNVGVIGRPENDGSTDVWYTLVSAEPELRIEQVALAYPHQRLADEMRQEGLPEEFVETVLTGWWTTCLEALPAKERARGRY